MTTRKVTVKVTAVFTGEVSKNWEEGVITLVGQHLRSSPVSMTDVEGNRLELSYNGRARVRVEFDK